MVGGERLRCTRNVSGLLIHFDDFFLEADFYVVDLVPCWGDSGYRP